MFCLKHQVGGIRVWRHHGEHTLTAGILHRHTAPSPGMMPARSPYLSPIENVWSMVAKRLTRHYTPITTVDELGHHVEAA
ncbi:hypothetical protein TNCV_3984561 [Trichonephila clavipes]|nr:hypothetical protein TNCV_3984561 [Trichonephila clavipes]